MDKIQKEHIGIDFGTTNIAVTGLIVDNELNRNFRVPYGEDGVPFPSILAIRKKEDGKLGVRFGRKVKSELGKLQEDGYYIIKSIKTETADREKKYNIFGKEFAPAKVVKALISAIKKHISINSKHSYNITEATIAVPVDFTKHQRAMIMDAFQEAGIRVNKIISESTAAYISNRKEVSGLTNTMVFDWGGGTLDISLLNIDKSKGRLNELATVGWSFAGDKIDEIIAEFIHNQLVKSTKNGISLSFKELSFKDRNKIINEAEKVKMDFSDEDEIDEDKIVSIVDYCGEKTVRYDFSYDCFCELLKPTIEKATSMIQICLEKAELSAISLDAIIMVGGSSNILPLHDYLEHIYGEQYNTKIVYPERVQWSVSEGAALIDSLDCGYALNQDINILLSDGTTYPLLKKEDKIPTQKCVVSFGTIDNSESANFVFCDDKNNLLARESLNSKGYNGERYYVEAIVENDLVAEIKLRSVYRAAGEQEKVFDLRSLSFYYDIKDLDKNVIGDISDDEE